MLYFKCKKEINLMEAIAQTLPTFKKHVILYNIC